MNRYDNNERYVSANPTNNTDWRVVGELLDNHGDGQQHIVDAMQQTNVAPRIVGTQDNPLLRGAGFGLVSVPFTLVIMALIGGVVILSFTGAVAFGWFLTGVGGLGLVVLTIVFALSERNSPGATDRRWAAADEHRSDNDTDVRLAIVAAERDVRLARLQVYRETQLQIGANEDEPVQRIDSSPRQLPG